MSLELLFTTLADVMDGDLDIERHGRQALIESADEANFGGKPNALGQPFLDVLQRHDAHPVCTLIAATPLPWAPPQTSNDPKYLAHSATKAHVELLGPEGLVPSHSVRLGIYGILPDSEYGIRTHPAEEVFIMLAGEADWKRGPSPYQRAVPGDRSFHPSMLPHATRTGPTAFMSVYIWRGDLSTDNYVYQGPPQ